MAGELSRFSFEDQLIDKPQSAEKNLLVALLERAVHDFFGNQQDEKVEAREWLFDDAGENDAFSFDWVCMHLDLNSAAVRSQLRQMRPRGDMHVGQWWCGTRRRA